MKTITQFGFALALLLTLSACSSDSSSSGGAAQGSGVGTLRAQIGSANFTSIPQAAQGILASNGSFQNLSISGADATGKTLQLSIIGENIGVGTYPLTEQSDIFSSVVYSEVNISNPASDVQSWAAPYDGGGNSGSIIITSKTDTNVKGTFSLTGKSVTGSGTKAITAGVFNVNITSN